MEVARTAIRTGGFSRPSSPSIASSFVSKFALFCAPSLFVFPAGCYLRLDLAGFFSIADPAKVDRFSEKIMLKQKIERFVPDAIARRPPRRGHPQHRSVIAGQARHDPRSRTVNDGSVCQSRQGFAASFSSPRSYLRSSFSVHRARAFQHSTASDRRHTENSLPARRRLSISGLVRPASSHGFHPPADDVLAPTTPRYGR